MILISFAMIFRFTRWVSPLRGLIARFFRRMAALQLLGME